MFLCVRGVDVGSFYDFSVGFYNCSDNVVFFVSFLLHKLYFNVHSF